LAFSKIIQILALVDAITAYFYGYDIVTTDRILKEELDFFTILLENIGAPATDVYFNNLAFKWCA